MKSLPILKKQILILFVFSVFASVGAIIHGIFFDLDFEQIKRLTIEGILLTFVLVFPTVLFLEWVFDLNNQEKFAELERKIEKLSQKRRK